MQKNIKIPKEYNYISAFLTLRCNFSCSYCVNNNSGTLKRVRKELSGSDWVRYLNRLDINDNIAITIAGGEPTIHKDFYEIINNLNHPVDLLTNLTFNVNDFIKYVKPNSMFKSNVPSYKSIRISYHPKFTNIKELVQKSTLLQENGFNIGIFSINYPHNTEDNMKLAEEARKNKIYFFIKDYLGEYNGKLVGHYKYDDAVSGKSVSVMCRIRELLINPDGDVFKCHRDLYADEYKINNIKDDDFSIDYEFRHCGNFGKCNPCDVKVKTNRFLKMGECSIEIQNLIGESWDV